MRNSYQVLATAILLGATAAGAAPVVTAGYDIQLYATGIGAVTGLEVGPDRALYAADNLGRVLRIDSSGAVTVVASGIPFPNDVTWTDSGRLFVASGGGQAVYEVVNGVGQVFATSGVSFPTSVQADGDSLLVANSGNGTIARVTMDSSSQIVLSGLSSPHGPFGLSFDKSGRRLYFIDHGTGGVYQWDFRRNPSLMALVTPLGGTFTGTGFRNRFFFTDTELGYLLWQEPNGSVTVFASGFSGKVSPPFIGPNGIAFDGPDKLYVGDGDSIYLVTPTR